MSLGGYGERYVTRFGLVAYTGNPGPNGVALMSGPVVVDPGTGEILGYAPIKDRDSVYSDNAHLTALGFVDPDTVLLMVTPMDFRTMESRGRRHAPGVVGLPHRRLREAGQWRAGRAMDRGCAGPAGRGLVTGLRPSSTSGAVPVP